MTKPNLTIINPLKIVFFIAAPSITCFKTFSRITISTTPEITELSNPPSDQEDITPPAATCPICQITLSRARDLNRHMKQHHSSPKPTEEIANLTSRTCITCNLEFGTFSLLKQHAKDVHNIVSKRLRRRKSEVQPLFFCDGCGKGYTRKHDMLKHRSGAHNTLPPLPSTRSRNAPLLEKCALPCDTGRAMYKCDLCERVFKDAYNFTRHRTVHTGVRPFCCHICGKSFRTSTGLNRHINESHLGVKRFSCDVCQKAFASKVTRDEHMNIHNNVRPFVCDICGNGFKQRASLRIHKLYHENNFRFVCEMCGKKFRRKSELKVHEWLHTGKKPYGCKKCPATFRLRHDLTRHMKTHDKIGECICLECGSTFGQERYLRVHMRIHQRQAKSVPNEEKSEDDKVVGESGA